MENLADIAIESGIVDGIQNINTSEINKMIPSNTFGCFVTIKRYHKLNKWPVDIHGCIGYWDDEYHEMKSEKVINKIREVSKTATKGDRRKKYFDPLLTDPLSSYEVSLMLLPIIKINKSGKFDLNGKTIQFDNMKYGLIVQQSNSRATYLPEVFESADWTMKAGIDSDQDTSFFAYQTKIIRRTILDYLINPIIITINSMYNDQIMYQIDGDKIIYKPNEYVRNCGTLLMIMQLLNLKMPNDQQVYVKNNMKRDIDHHYKLFIKSPKEMRQSMAFLLMVMLEFDNEYDEKIDNIGNYLLKHIEDLEPDFEYGEVMMSLSALAINRKKYIDKILPILRSERDKILNSFMVNNKNDIFRYNWHVQFLAQLNQLDCVMNNEKINLFIKRVIELTSQYDNMTETNYLAVGIEALSGFRIIQKNSSNQISNTIVNNEINRLFELILQRRNKYGLFAFLNGSARFDITGHMVNAIKNLIIVHHMNKCQNGGMINSYINKKNYMMLSN